MHKCVNNSIGNVYHLEQFVSEFFPYSQKQLGFDQPVTIRFESDRNNAGVMLGKTAYYDPNAMEIALYVDGRHPKDVMRSLSHELVHHAQNCRGDFGGCEAPGWELGSANGNAACIKDTGVGYAQRDPHLRKMEREAYTKGNLIFRDFEDLIKTGKINCEIDFSNSGEPKMSLKELRSANFNKNIMKKWGLLKESQEHEESESEKAYGATELPELSEDDKYKESEHYGEDESADKREEDSLEHHLDAIERHLKDLRDDMGFDQHREDDHMDEGNDPEGDPEDYTGTRETEEEEIKSLSTTGIPEAVSRKISIKEAQQLALRLLERLRKENN